MSAQPNLRPEGIQPARTSLSEHARSYFLHGVYTEPELVADVHQSGVVELYFDSSGHFESSLYRIPIGATVTHAVQAPTIESLTSNHYLAQLLCNQHPSISTYTEIFGGIPHLKGLRLSVADILGQLYLLGSIEAVQKIYSPDVSEDQIKEAIAYAQDFLESALSS